METPSLPDAMEPTPWRTYPARSNYASTAGNPCAMTLWFQRTHWRERKPPDKTLRRIFAEGNHWERRIVAALLERGIDVVRQQESLQWPELQLAGRMDGYLPALKAVPDIKSMSDFAFDSIRSVDDLRDSDESYHHQYLAQVGLYATHPDVRAKWCLLYCVRRSTGQTRQIWFTPDDVQADIERAKANCEGVNAHLEDTVDPAAQALANPGPYCQRCDWSHLCPAYSLEAAGLQLADENVTAMVARRQELLAQLAEPKAELEALDKRLKAHWKTTGAGLHAAGDFLVKVTEVAAKEMPAKAAYTRKAYQLVSYKPVNPEG